MKRTDRERFEDEVCGALEGVGECKSVRVVDGRKRGSVHVTLAAKTANRLKLRADLEGPPSKVLSRIRDAAKELQAKYFAAQLAQAAEASQIREQKRIMREAEERQSSALCQQWGVKPKTSFYANA